MSSTLARDAASEMLASASSVVSAHAFASSALRLYCVVACRLWRSVIARAVPYGSSDGRLICFWEAILAWALVSRPLTMFSCARMLRCVIPVVMRVLIRPPARCG